MDQRYTSQDTSIPVVNKVYTHYAFPAGARVLDYGGGRYDLNTEYMAERGVSVAVYDPYNRSADHNARVLREARATRPDYVVCSNVLNVIMEEEIIKRVVRDLAGFDTRVLITVYEGDRTGRGRATSKGYQRNEKLSAYLPIVERYLQTVSTSNGILECIPKR